MVEAIRNVRLSDNIERNATGGPGFKTSIISTISGNEFRNIEWSHQRGKWDVGYVDHHEVIEEIIAFFQVMRGRAYGFRFKDWSDYKVNNVFALGDGVTTVFQAAKVYEAGTYTFTRPLTRLVAPIAVTVGGVNQAFTVNVDTGLITFTTAPAVDVEIALTCEFDVPVRFDTDDLPITMITADLSRLQSVPLVEIRDRKDPT